MYWFICFAQWKQQAFLKTEEQQKLDFRSLTLMIVLLLVWDHNVEEGGPVGTEAALSSVWGTTDPHEEFRSKTPYIYL